VWGSGLVANECGGGRGLPPGVRPGLRGSGSAGRGNHQHCGPAWKQCARAKTAQAGDLMSRADGTQYRRKRETTSPRKQTAPPELAVSPQRALQPWARVRHQAMMYVNDAEADPRDQRCSPTSTQTRRSNNEERRATTVNKSIDRRFQGNSEVQVLSERSRRLGIRDARSEPDGCVRKSSGEAAPTQ